MCDYSLHNVATRPARVGDKLVTTTFRNTSTRGLADIEQPWIAVCLRPGTELSFDESVVKRWYQRLLDPFTVLHRVNGRAIFLQVNQAEARAHHDAVEFADGKVWLLTYLATGQRVTVLQLPVDPNKQRAPDGVEHDTLLPAA